MTYAPTFWLEPFPTSGLTRCTARSDDNPLIWYAGGVEQVYTDFFGYYDTALISKAARRRDWVNRILDHMNMMTDALNASR